MVTEPLCPSCGKPLAADAPRDLCPECLLKAGLGTEVAAGRAEPANRVPFVPPEPAELAPLFPQLEIVELLGHGGMGAVYKARQPALDRWIALKILPAQAAAQTGFAERFTREARALARLNHPHIVAVHEFGQADGLPYLILEYVDGVTLRALLLEQRLTPEHALRVVPQICEALQFAHDAGVIHRDIKPENILLDKKGWVKIADFGIAKMVEGRPGQSAITLDEQVIGTPLYMAPEQIEHPQRVDRRADIYSLGVVFYEMLTGELPLGKFPLPSRTGRIDVRLDDIVLHALEKEPERRYQHASEVRTDVETVASLPPPFPEGRGTDPRRRPRAASVLSGLRERIVPRSRKALVVWAFTASLAAAWFLGVFLYRQSRMDITEPAAKAGIWGTSPPRTADEHLTAGFNLLFKKRDPVGARAVFELCVRDQPDEAEAYHGLALAQREAGDPAKALSNHDRALDLSPDRADYYFARGVTYQRLHNPDAAIKDFELGLAQKPVECLSPGFLQLRLAQCYRTKGDFQKALEYIDQAIALDPQNQGFYRERGDTYQALGDPQRAEADFNRSHGRATLKQEIPRLTDNPKASDHE